MLPRYSSHVFISQPGSWLPWKACRSFPCLQKYVFLFLVILPKSLFIWFFFKNNDTMEKRSVEWLPTWLSKYFSSSAKVSSFLSICSSVCFNLFISMIKAFLPKLKKESDPEPPVFHFLKQIKIKTNQYWDWFSYPTSALKLFDNVAIKSKNSSHFDHSQ